MATPPDLPPPEEADTLLLEEVVGQLSNYPPEQTPPVAQALADLLSARLEGKPPPPQARQVLEEFLSASDDTTRP